MARPRYLVSNGVTGTSDLEGAILNFERQSPSRIIDNHVLLNWMFLGRGFKLQIFVVIWFDGRHFELAVISLNYGIMFTCLRSRRTRNTL